MPVFLLIVLSVFYSLLALAFPWIGKIVYDDMLTTFDRNLLLMILFSLFGVLFLSVISNSLSELCATYIRNRLVKDVRNDILEKLLHYRYDFFTNNDVGNIVEKIIPEVDTLTNVIVTVLKDSANLLKIFLILIIVSFFNIWVALLFSMVSVFFILWHTVFKAYIKKSMEKVQEVVGDLYGFFYDNLGNIKHIKIHTVETSIREILEENLFKLKKLGIQSTAFDYVLRLSMKLSEITFLVILTYCFFQIKSNQMSIGTYFFYGGIISLIIWPMSELVNLGATWQYGLVAVKRIESILDYKSENIHGIVLSKINSGIKLENVELKFQENIVLKNINLKVNKGDNIAIVGHSGSGKTSIANLIAGIYNPSNGKIIIDNTDINLYNITSVRDRICFFSQDVFLFNETVRNTIDPEEQFSDKFIKETLVKVGLDKFCDRLNIKIGENGSRISGGERQRLGLARVLVKEFDVLILDEATSNVDQETEKLINNTIKNLRIENNYLITITITHRENNLNEVDEIIVMDKGEIVEKGSMKYLINNGLEFKKIFLDMEK